MMGAHARGQHESDSVTKYGSEAWPVRVDEQPIDEKRLEAARE